MSKVKVVRDLKYVGEGDLTEFGITTLTDRKRIMEMMAGDEDTKLMFKLQNSTQARGIIAPFISDEEKIKDVLATIGEEKLTGF
jgi:hypothetical protein